MKSSRVARRRLKELRHDRRDPEEELQAVVVEVPGVKAHDRRKIQERTHPVRRRDQNLECPNSKVTPDWHRSRHWC